MKIPITADQNYLLNLIKKSRTLPIPIVKHFLLNPNAPTCTLNNEYLARLLKSTVPKISADLQTLKNKKLINTITILRIRYIEIIENKLIKVKK